MRKFSFLILFVASCLYSKSQTWEDTVKQIGNYFSRYKSSNPGAQLAISRHGKVIYSNAWGMADLEHQVPLTTASITEAGSVSKQFTAAAVLLLEQQGKLSLDDDVRKHIPELPDYGRTITLRHMIQHKSGLKDWGHIGTIGGWPRTTKTYSNEDALYIICRQKTLNHLPGDEYLYSNSNYQLLAIIVQRVSGLSLADYTRKYIFEPAGMKHTRWRDNYKRIVPNRAIAYSRSGTDYQTNMPNEFVYGNGGLLTTAEDLLIWCDYFLSGKLGNPSLLEKQLERTTLTNGVLHRYAAGLFVGKFRGWNYVAHDGATAGYRANLEAYPELGLAIAWLSNTSEFDRDTVNVAELVADYFVPVREPEENKPAPATYALSQEKMKSYSGWYRNPRSGEGIRLSMQGDKLTVSKRGVLTPVAENKFMIGNIRLEMEPARILVVNSNKDSVYLDRVDVAAENEKTLNEYVGEYYSDEAEAKYYLEVRNGKLVLIQKPRAAIPLTPTYKDGFESASGTLYFERENKKIVGLKVSIERARNVEFKKIK